MKVRLEILEYRWFCKNCNTFNYTEENANNVKCIDCGKEYEVD